ncbi:MAG TPA: divergent polysaccharide deacetylase family protein [Propylenella sp.]|nr:divergent polysaccharide deacetylase family protein [Propylenella sp.]
MAANDLNTPLYGKVRTASMRRSVLATAIIATSISVALIAAVWVAVVDDPDGGRPVAVAIIRDAAPTATGSLTDPQGGYDAAMLDPRYDADTGAGDGLELAGLPIIRGDGSVPTALLEPSAFGPLPRVAPDGRRPRDVYARRAPAVPDGVPRVVIVVGGMGLSQTGTQKAIEALPEDVTLAFAPYGSSLQRWVEKARAEGHEALLQIPLEPQGYPEENPGEHTLTTSDQRAAAEDLAWALGRMTSYAGVMNYMGGRFLGDEDALVPFLGEIGARGLFYLEDGSSPESLADSVGTALGVPVVTADLIVDQVRAPEAIEQELMALEAIARTNGLAVGVASAFPVSVEQIARWAEGASSRGVAIVPASAALPP